MVSNSLAFNLDLASDLYNSREQFPVDFENAWQWLGYANKRNGKESFLNYGFVEEIEFCRTSTKKPQAGRPSLSIVMTVDCFKTWAMMAQTEQGKQVRLYFLECEKIAKGKPPKTPLELHYEHVLYALEHERRMAAIEKENEEIRKAQKFADDRLVGHEDRIEHIEAELDRFSNGHGNYFSIIGYARLTGVGNISLDKANKLGREATKVCKDNNIKPEPVSDPRFGVVNSYPESVLVLLDW